MLTVLLLDPAGRGFREGGVELLSEPGVRWIDIHGDLEVELMRLKEPFGLHRLSIEDCLHVDQRPKLEEYPGHVFLVLQGFLQKSPNPCDLELHELDIFLGNDWIISVHEGLLPAVQRVKDRMTRAQERPRELGADGIAYLLADELVDLEFPILDAFSDEIEDVQDAIFQNPTQEHLRRISALKRALVTLRRVLSPQRDVVGLLARRGIPHVTEKTSLYFRDVYDHLIRLYEQIESNRDFLSDAMGAYLSNVANRTNEITKQLTVFATIFLPLSFITGFFGQNFEILSHPFFFWVMLTSVVALPLGLLGWFRRRQWL